MIGVAHWPTVVVVAVLGRPAGGAVGRLGAMVGQEYGKIAAPPPPKPKPAPSRWPVPVWVEVLLAAIVVAFALGWGIGTVHGRVTGADLGPAIIVLVVVVLNVPGLVGLWVGSRGSLEHVQAERRARLQAERRALAEQRRLRRETPEALAPAWARRRWPPPAARSPTSRSTTSSPPAGAPTTAPGGARRPWCCWPSPSPGTRSCKDTPTSSPRSTVTPRRSRSRGAPRLGRLGHGAPALVRIRPGQRARRRDLRHHAGRPTRLRPGRGERRLFDPRVHGAAADVRGGQVRERLLRDLSTKGPPASAPRTTACLEMGVTLLVSTLQPDGVVGTPNQSAEMSVALSTTKVGGDWYVDYPWPSVARCSG